MDLTGVVAVIPAVMHRRPPSRRSVHHHLTEVQPFEMPHERPLFNRSEELGNVTETLGGADPGRAGIRVEKCTLLHFALHPGDKNESTYVKNTGAPCGDRPASLESWQSRSQCQGPG